VREGYIAQQATELARKAGEARLEALKKSDAADGFGAVSTVSRTKVEGMEPKALEAIMRADVSKLPAVVGVDLGTGYAIYRITRLSQPAQANAAQRVADAQQLGQLAGQTELEAFYESLKGRSKVKVLKPVVAADAQGGSAAAAQ